MLNKLRNNIESLMYGKGKPDASLSEKILSGLSCCYGKTMALRASLYRENIKKRETLPCYVVSVGNITVGGTGKTPMVIYLASLIRKSGLKLAVVSRGYGGEASGSGGLVSTGDEILMDAKKAGDEPFMTAKRLLEFSVPVVIGSNRFKAGMAAVEKFNPDVILLDDGFQHLRLKRDLDILLFDGKSPTGNGNIIPRGILREPVCAMKRADLFVLTRFDSCSALSPFKVLYDSVSDFVSAEEIRDIPVFSSTHEPYIHGRIKPGSDKVYHHDEPVGETAVFAFSGIAKNHEFRKTAKKMGFRINDYFEFPDHYCYTEEDCVNIALAAGKSGVKTLITSEKDYVKIAGLAVWDFELVIIGVAIDFGNFEKDFNELVKSKIRSINY